MERFGNVEPNVAIDSAMGRMPVGIVPGELVRSDLVNVFGNGFVDFGRKFGEGSRALTICSVSLFCPAIRIADKAIVTHHGQHVRTIEVEVRR